jgi:hypothetical protein
VSQISPQEASDILEKLFSEKVRVSTFFNTSSGARVRLDGFLTGARPEEGLFITSRPDGGGDWINVRPFKVAGMCTFSYGEAREVGEELRGSILGESALIINFLATGKHFAIFFTL